MTINAPLFSIVTVTKDNLAGFLETRKSVEAQSFKDFEWIVVDGNSTDGTKAHLPQDAVSEPDKGIYDAMNKGINRAKGDYVLFLNAGDLFADVDILSTISMAIKTHKPDFLYGDALEGGFYKKARSHRKMDWGMFTHHQAMIYQREKISILRYDTDMKIAADYSFTLRFIRNAQNIHYIPCAICIFEEGGISQRQRKTGRLEQYRQRAKHKACSPVKNVIVYGGQSCSAFLREKFPRLYQGLKNFIFCNRTSGSWRKYSH